MKIVQGYKEKNNATTGMMAKMKKMLDEKLQYLERENKILEDRTNNKDIMENARSEETFASRKKKAEEGKKHNFIENNMESLEDSMESSSRIVNSRRTTRHEEKAI